MRWSWKKAAGKQGRLTYALMRTDLVILDELGYLPFSQAGGALLFHLLSNGADESAHRSASLRP